MIAKRNFPEVRFILDYFSITVIIVELTRYVYVKPLSGAG